MGFKRYGGSFQFSGSGNSWIALAGFALLLGFSVSALIFNSPLLMIPGFSLLFILGTLSSLFSGGQLSCIKGEMHRDYVQKALHAYGDGH